MGCSSVDRPVLHRRGYRATWCWVSPCRMHPAYSSADTGLRCRTGLAGVAAEKACSGNRPVEGTTSEARARSFRKAPRGDGRTATANPATAIWSHEGRSFGTPSRSLAAKAGGSGMRSRITPQVWSICARVDAAVSSRKSEDAAIAGWGSGADSGRLGIAGRTASVPGWVEWLPNRSA